MKIDGFKIFLIIFTVLGLGVLVFCLKVGREQAREERPRTYYQAHVITKKGEQIAKETKCDGCHELFAIVAPGDSIKTVVLTRHGKEYFFDIRK